MIKISNDVTIKQVMELTNKETGEISYLIMSDEGDWQQITQEEYNKLTRGNKNGE